MLVATFLAFCAVSSAASAHGEPEVEEPDMEVTLLQMRKNLAKATISRFRQDMSTSCSVNDHVMCPNSDTRCAGDQCCPDGSTCPSASVNHVEGCHSGKAHDCTVAPSPSPSGSCSVNDHVMCPNSDTRCAGDQCCPDGSTCPSASVPHVNGCNHAKAHDCTVAFAQIMQRLTTSCSVNDHVMCPNSDTRCAGDQCCPDGSTCPSASVNHVEGCHSGKAHDCTVAPSPSPSGSCSVNDHVMCPNSDTRCAGDQCCPDGSTCPSASVPHVNGCNHAKAHDCTVAFAQIMQSTMHKTNVRTGCCSSTLGPQWSDCEQHGYCRQGSSVCMFISACA